MRLFAWYNTFDDIILISMEASDYKKWKTSLKSSI